jgi:CO/xanthine dehydrogenase FAD-binding subunit
MDLPNIKSCLSPRTPEEITSWPDGQAWLAGGTWLYSEAQPLLRTLVDMGKFGWPALQPSAGGLEISATCTIAQLASFPVPAEWVAGSLFEPCCHALQSSFKIWHEATVGGNLCLSLPAGALIALTAALEGTFLLWPRNSAPRTVPAIEFVTGNHQNVLAPGELLRSVHLPVSALRKRAALRRFSLTQEGRSSVLIIGTRCPATDEFLLTITAATVRPVQLRFSPLPGERELMEALDQQIPTPLYLADSHGTPAHRQHLTRYFAAQILSELA